ncbi:Gfo/Idh/MocA family oxidoreductase [Rhizobium sp. TH2]|uniref:Gfo/Idh/MocA family protein n=1 Tax=Rhizobium sp. TH2 TaxID=2775403 RepID=UPI002157CC69|nr:Gfo/Idh/MocA family oxidoreductase [Rhizobium sp. TH2]UVC07375.1 Gfo/Idh/MocA family oxidoreductase [Rhizobium sp. TH2]
MPITRVGIIGTGVMGSDHARILASCVAGAELAGVFDVDQARAVSLAEETGARVFDGATALIADQGIDAIIVCSPDATHSELALACIAAGKPALVEKPLASTVAGAVDVMKAETTGGRRLIQVGFTRRFDPGYIAMKEALASDRLGQALFLHCIHRNAVGPDYLTSELVIASSAGHEFDITRFLLEDEIVSATVASPRASRLAPNRQPQFILLETASGVIVDIEVFVDCIYGYDVRAELVCEKGTVSLNTSPATMLRHAGYDGFETPPDWRDRFKHAYRQQLQGWIDAIHGMPNHGASTWDGYRSMKVTEACLAACRSGQKTAVPVEEMPTFYR